MIDKIAFELSNYIASNLTFIDKWAGLVKPLKKTVQGVDKVFPVAINTPSNCLTDDYTALTPDSSKKCIIYIEKAGNQSYENISTNNKIASVGLRLVVWYNLDKLLESKYVSEDTILQQFYEVLPRRLPNNLFSGAVKQVHIMPLSDEYGASVASQYTYNESKTQYATFPYGFFAIDLDVWYVPVYCHPDLNILDGCMTGIGNHGDYTENE